MYERFVKKADTLSLDGDN